MADAAVLVPTSTDDPEVPNGIENPTYTPKDKEGEMTTSFSNGMSLSVQDPVKPKTDEEDAEDEAVQCGWLGWHPKCLRFLNSSKGWLLFISIFAVAQGMTVNGVIYVSTTTLERRFSLTSVKSGFISSCYDFAVMSVVVFVTYFGERGNKPKWLAFGALTFCMGSIVFTLPHFLTGLYNAEGNFFDTCNETRADPGGCDASDEPSLSKYYGVFIFAQVLHGLGAAPLYTLGLVYLDENTSPKTVAIYIAIFQACSTMGPAVGYLLGGMFLDIYTDFGKVDESELDITPASPLWVGAWWLGLIVSACITISIVIPFLGFPFHLPSYKKVSKERVSEAQKGSEFSARAGYGVESLKDFPRAAWTLIKNPTYMVLNMVSVTEWFMLASIAVFGPKYLESMFNMTAGNAALVAGILTTPSGLIGCLFGGWIVNRFKLKFRGMIKFCIGSLSIGFFMVLAFLMTCPNVPFAGVTVQYQNSSVELGNLTAPCNLNCQCETSFDPVCGSNDVMYFSACLAGCREEDDVSEDELQTYRECGCIGNGGTAELGRCKESCVYFIPFLLLLFLFITFTFFAVVPSITATLRCVSNSQRTFALGLQSLLYRGLGTVPGPVIFGAIIDKTCLVWEEDECDGARTCWMYDNADLSLYSFLMLAALRILSIIFLIGTLLTYKPSLDDVDGENDANKLTENNDSTTEESNRK
ncbi:solute carrier organic anion transporter family member 4A1-like [Amphiura filiformis]|uniref:solute carrier organic anion transporter family member 4A1-like n=1 Tax=Amphiura filiformis TaxID=82378 RepID=UPI003B21C938